MSTRPRGAGAPSPADAEDPEAVTTPKRGWSLAADAADGLGATVLVRFTAQAWINDCAVAVDPQGPTTFRVCARDAQDATGAWLQSNSHASDPLREHPKAPRWVRDWTGPFEIEIEIDRDALAEADSGDPGRHPPRGERAARDRR